MLCPPKGRRRLAGHAGPAERNADSEIAASASKHVEPALAINVDRPMLYSAVSNLLQNAFKFTRAHGHVSLRAYATSNRVLIEIEDQCGGIPAGKLDAMFLPYEQHAAARSGLGLGLSIARRAVEASRGTLRVRDMPGLGCVFTIDLPRVDS